MLQERLRKQDRYQLKFQACVKMQHNRQFPRSHADTFAKMMFFPVSFSKSCLQGSKICICILLDTYNAFHEYNYIIHINQRQLSATKNLYLYQPKRYKKKQKALQFMCRHFYLCTCKISLSNIDKFFSITKQLHIQPTQG